MHVLQSTENTILREYVVSRIPRVRKTQTFFFCVFVLFCFIFTVGHFLSLLSFFKCRSAHVLCPGQCRSAHATCPQKTGEHESITTKTRTKKKKKNNRECRRCTHYGRRSLHNLPQYDQYLKQYIKKA